MRIAIVGGGPGGLYLAALMKQLDAGHEVTVWERNAPDDTFGFGVVFSDETLGGIESADTTIYRAMESRFARWTDIDVAIDGQSSTIGGQGFAAMSRKELLRILQTRVAELGVEVHYRTVAPDTDELRASYDLVVAADGLNSQVRTRYADAFGPSLDPRHNKYIWFGTDLVFEAFQFIVRNTEFGTMQIHGYPYSDQGSTFIVEMHEDVWRRAGFDRTEDEVFPPGVSDEYAVQRVAEIFADDLGGHRILTNNSKWLNFTTVRNAELARRQRRPARRRRPHRALLHRLGHQARDGGRPGPGRVPARARLRAESPCGIPGRAQAGGRVDPARRAGQPRVVREHRDVCRPGP